MIKFILSALIKLANLKGIKHLAEYLEQSPGKVYGWIRNGNISDISSVLIKFPHVRREWLETGQGPMLKENAPKNEIAAAVDIVYDIQDKPREIISSWVEPMPQEPPSTEHHSEDWNLDEMLEKTSEVLQSQTIYRSALAANVRAFHEAVQNEGEMRTTRETLARMEARMARMEKAILAMAGPVTEKREQTGG